MQLCKVWSVKVKAYMTQDVPKYTKYFRTREDAFAYESELTDKIWTSPVFVFVEECIGAIDDNGKVFAMLGTFVEA
jgi:hypothetical protein